MSLEIRAQVPERGVELELTVPTGRTTGIIGPNGAGKTTLLSLVAGMLRPHQGRIALEGRVLAEVRDGQLRSWVPPHAREVATLTQDPTLFPHLTALGNIMFGLRARGVPSRRARARARHWLEELGIGELAGRRPSQLSGGQAQRVAIARALVTEPRLLLLDEPMAALDIDVAPLLREQLRRFLDGRTALVVSHDVLDAMTLTTDLGVITEGNLVEHGPTLEVLTRPRSAFAARFGGLNLLRGTWDGWGLQLESGEHLRGAPSQDLREGAPALAAFRPSAVSVGDEASPTTGATVLARPVTVLAPRDDLVRVRAGEIAADITAQQIADLGLVPGTRVHLTIDPAAVTLYPDAEIRGDARR